QGLGLFCICEREDPRDAFVSNTYASLDALPKGSIVGTSSLRRQAQLLALRPDLRISSLRGNVDTRLRKLMEGHYDAIILATSGLKRLELSAPVMDILGPPAFLPAVGQGALGIECRADRPDLLELLAFMEHPATRICVEAERGFLAGLQGGCQVPIAGYATLNDSASFTLEGFVAQVDGTQALRQSITAEVHTARQSGLDLAARMYAAGAKEILACVYAETAQ
ncbi:MAG: hydroxymethylbilane synthase, partial [Desulfovibrionaceae bacterium]